MTTPGKPRRKITVVLAGFAVLLFLAAGAFGTLWFIERGDHDTTRAQLTAARTEAEDNKTKQKAAETKATDAEGKWHDATAERQKAQNAKEREALCAGNSRDLIAAVKANKQAEAEKLLTSVVMSCI
jgi:flagellar basal body-associated protein FliL